MSRVPLLGIFVKALEERSVFLTRAWKKTPPPDEPESVANDFMRLLLQDYHGVDDPVKEPEVDEHDEAASYVTTCIKMTREATPSSPNKGVEATGSIATSTPANPPGHPRPLASGQGPAKKEVHIYECYWADLSRPKNTILSFFQGLYQLLFHLGSLSRLAISTGTAAEENGKSTVWKCLDWTQLWAVRILTLPIPILNLILFISIIGALPHLVEEKWARGAVTVCAAVLGSLLYAVLSKPKRMRATPGPITWAMLPLAYAVVFGGVGWLLSQWISRWSLLALEGWIVGAGIIYLSISSYDEVRDGAQEVAWTLYGASFLTFLIILWSIRGKATSIEQATLWMMQIILAALRLSWFLLIVLAFATLLLGSMAWRRKSLSEEGRARAKAAVRTSRFALAMPALGILIVTLALWSGLFVKTSNKPACAACPSRSLAMELFGKKTPDGEEAPETLKVPSWVGPFFLNNEDAENYSALPDDANSMSPDAYFRGLFVWSATPAFPLVLVLILISIFLLFVWLLPSILTESKPPRGSDNESSLGMGKWLSRGLDATVIGVALLWTAAFFMPVLFLILHGEKVDFRSLDSPTALVLQWLGLATGSLAILASVAKSGSSVLGIILDVDNYLRTSPKEKTPRARIVERYVSLLRYLADEKNGGYERIVILAHSLGALISGDLLLYLKAEGDPDLSGFGLGTKIPIRLFTMGDPARQFLNRFFPYLYEWVRDTPDNGLTHLGKLTPTRPNTRIERTPNPNGLGLERWVNAYRSGDYIGRSLWLNEWYGRTTTGTGEYPQAISVAQDNAMPPTREEMCIGAGAHQHYWDQSAPDIAEKLDLLISP